MNRKPQPFLPFSRCYHFGSRYVLSGSTGNLLSLMQANQPVEPTRLPLGGTNAIINKHKKELRYG